MYVLGCVRKFRLVRVYKISVAGTLAPGVHISGINFGALCKVEFRHRKQFSILRAVHDFFFFNFHRFFDRSNIFYDQDKFVAALFVHRHSEFGTGSEEKRR